MSVNVGHFRFLWIVGLCIPLSLRSSSSQSVLALTKKILQVSIESIVKLGHRSALWQTHNICWARTDGLYPIIYSINSFIFVLQRTVIIYIFGLTFNSVNNGPVNIFRIRALGILQRIAVCYGVVSLINVFAWRSQVAASVTANLVHQIYLLAST